MQLRRVTDIGAMDESTCRKATLLRPSVPVSRGNL